MQIWKTVNAMLAILGNGISRYNSKKSLFLFAFTSKVGF